MTKENVFNFFTAAIPIVISLIALYLSYSPYKNEQKDREANLKIIQNLWSEDPRFELVNESMSKLDNTPSPTYLMFIPSKLMFLDKDRKPIGSNMILSPISYDMISTQIVGNQTKDSIVTSYLPKNFYAKKGTRDMQFGKIHKLSEEINIQIQTLPFLVIVSPLEYTQNKKEYTKFLLSTPLGNLELEEQDYLNIKTYFKQNSKKLEIRIDGDNSIYQTAQQNVEKVLKPMTDNKKIENDDFTSILGNDETGGQYGQVLKKINHLITPVDPLA